METAIILQGFKEAKSKYGLTYTTFIGDGDQGFIQDFRFGGGDSTPRDPNHLLMPVNSSQSGRSLDVPW